MKSGNSYAGLRVVGFVLSLVVCGWLHVVPSLADELYSDNSWVGMGGAEFGANGSVYGMFTADNGDLYVCGDFTSIGGVSASRVARWDGEGWHAISDDEINAEVYSVIVDGDRILIAGAFEAFGPNGDIYGFACYEGGNWSDLGANLVGEVYAMALYEGAIYLGGEISYCGGIACSNAAKLEGGVWSSLGSGFNGLIYAMEVWGGKLFFGGNFTNAGGTVAPRLASWDGSSFTRISSGLDGPVFALAATGGSSMWVATLPRLMFWGQTHICGWQRGVAVRGAVWVQGLGGV